MALSAETNPIRMAFFVLIIASWLIGVTVSAAEPVTLKLRQAWAILPNITAYLSLQDADGNPIVGDVEPTQLSATMGPHTATVTAVQSFTDSGEGIAYIFLVDVSKSLREAQFAPIRTALTEWVEKMRDQDRGALMTFGSEVTLAQDFTADQDTLKRQIAALRPTDNDTRLHRGLVQAMDLGRRQDTDLPRRRVIVTLSDGQDDFMGGMTREEVLAHMAEDRVPIYAIGFYRPPRTPEKEAGLETLGAFARQSGGSYYNAIDKPLAEVFADLRELISQVVIVHLNCPDCRADGRPYRLHLTVRTDNSRMGDGLELRLLPSTTTTSVEPAATETSSQEQETSPTPTQTDSMPQQPTTEEPPAGPRTESDSTSNVTEEIAPETTRPLPWWAVVLAVVVIVAVSIAFLMHRRANQPTPVSESVPSVPGSAPLPPQSHKPVASASGLPLKLIKLGDNPPHAFELRVAERATIGRHPQCDVMIPDDDELSSTHCALVRDGDKLFIQDLDSTNGTVLNGVPVTGRHRLQDGDRILLGRTDLRVSLGSAT